MTRKEMNISLLEKNELVNINIKKEIVDIKTVIDIEGWQYVI